LSGVSSAGINTAVTGPLGPGMVHTNLDIPSETDFESDGFMYTLPKCCNFCLQKYFPRISSISEMEYPGALPTPAPPPRRPKPDNAWRLGITHTRRVQDASIFLERVSSQKKKTSQHSGSKQEVNPQANTLNVQAKNLGGKQGGQVTGQKVGSNDLVNYDVQESNLIGDTSSSTSGPCCHRCEIKSSTQEGLRFWGNQGPIPDVPSGPAA